MKTLITTALASLAFAGLVGRADARDYCGGHHHSHHHHGHFHGSCSSFGLSFGLPLFYSRPVYSYGYHPYPTRSVYYGRSYGYYPGARSSTAVEVQVALARRGYYYGAIDGVIGPMSRSAIYRYQASCGLPPTGVIDYRLLRVLGL